MRTGGKWALVMFLLCETLLKQGSTSDCIHSPSKKVWVVVIDPGHGGKDPGCLGARFKEKTVALNVSLKLGQLLEEDENVKVIYTRKTDEFIPLNDRAEIANRNHADFFICIHCNASEMSDKYGAATYVMGMHKSEGNLEVEKRENSAILYEKNYRRTYNGFDPNSGEAAVLLSMYQNVYLSQSLDLSEKIENEYHSLANRTDNGVKQAGFLVLWKTAMPSLLTEIGFLTNPEEENYLGSQNGQDEIARAIFYAFEEYKAEKESQTYTPKPIVSKDERKMPDTISNEKDEVNVVKPKVVKDTSSVVARQTNTKTMKTSDTAISPPLTRNKDTLSSFSGTKQYPKNIRAIKPVDTISGPTQKRINNMRVAVNNLQGNKETGSEKTIIKKDTTHPIPLPDTSKIIYRIQIYSSTQSLSSVDKKFENLSDVWRYSENLLFKYTTGKFSSLEDAFKYLNKIKQEGFKDAFIVRFKGNQRVYK